MNCARGRFYSVNLRRLTQQRMIAKLTNLQITYGIGALVIIVTLIALGAFLLIKPKP